MIVPTDLEQRESFYQELIRKCTASQDSRSETYILLRHYFLYGRSPDEDETPFNKIYPQIDTLVSFLFASETTKFSIHLPPGEPDVEYKRVKTLNKALNDLWLSSNTDHVFGQTLMWSLVYNSMFVKAIPRVNETTPFSVVPFAVDPGSFGVLREDLPYTERQEAFVHSYYTTKSQLTKDLTKHPQRDLIIASVTATPVQADQRDGLDRLLLTATTPNVVGNVNENLNLQVDYTPQVDEELVRMHELWLWDDEIADYRVVTRVDNGMTVYDRKNFFLPADNNFVQICPNPMYSYYWGRSEVGGMTGLQKWRNERVGQIRKLLSLQVQPPTAITGWMGLLEEKQYAAFQEGSFLSTDSMQAKVDRFAPQLPQDLFIELREIDDSFSELSGLQNILMGKGEKGVRSGEQASQLARLSSARIKKRALIVEDALEELATMYLKLMRKHDKTEYKDDDGNAFVASEFTENFVVKVDAHSNSPLFIEDQNALARELMQFKAIDRERFIEMVSPPEKEQMLRDLKVIEQKEQEQAKQKMEFELKLQQEKHAK